MAKVYLFCDSKYRRYCEFLTGNDLPIIESTLIINSFLYFFYLLAFLKRLRSGVNEDFRSITLVELSKSSAVGATLIGAKQAKETISVDYSKNYKVLYQSEL